MKNKKHDTEIPPLELVCTSVLKREHAEQVAHILNCTILDTLPERDPRKNASYLHFADKETTLLVNMDRQSMTLRVDFAEGKAAYRRLHGGGRGQLIAKAIGMQKSFMPHVLDCTAGLGGDAFVLASLGCKVSMLERAMLSACLLSDGLYRGKLSAEEEGDEELLAVLNRMSLNQTNSLEFLQAQAQANSAFDVVYLDPMFPERKKSAAVKKEMQIFHHYIGADADADELLEPALALATYRVVVKRPAHAPFLANQEPNHQVKGKSTRFDIYTLRAMPSA